MSVIDARSPPADAIAAPVQGARGLPRRLRPAKGGGLQSLSRGRRVEGREPQRLDQPLPDELGVAKSGRPGQRVAQQLKPEVGMVRRRASHSHPTSLLEQCLDVLAVRSRSVPCRHSSSVRRNGAADLDSPGSPELCVLSAERLTHATGASASGNRSPRVVEASTSPRTSASAYSIPVIALEIEPIS